MFDKKKIIKETKRIMIPSMNKTCPGWKKNIDSVKEFNRTVKRIADEKSNPIYTDITKIEKKTWKGEWPWPVECVTLKSVKKIRRKFLFVEINGKTYALDGITSQYYHIPVVSDCVTIKGDISPFIMYIRI